MICTMWSLKWPCIYGRDRFKSHDLIQTFDLLLILLIGGGVYKFYEVMGQDKIRVVIRVGHTGEDIA